ncbi:hypothetical protein AV530_002857 [Patagioenas fasciata monilis]|uniref:Uncharacterized protein n=1 Tax=Patagioenas fasciata monilis TaxID=372326 RepID=A0A1V4K9K3_PATFA|nr:hypothetical protein AV530_002857 [Patagioenas fasciata monilis]
MPKDRYTGCSLPNVNGRQCGHLHLFLTWMCSAICFPHNIETGTAEGYPNNFPCELNYLLWITNQDSKQCWIKKTKQVVQPRGSTASSWSYRRQQQAPTAVCPRLLEERHQHPFSQGLK